MWKSKSKRASRAGKEVKVATIAGRATMGGLAGRLHVQVAEACAALIDEGFTIVHVNTAHMNAMLWGSKFITVIVAERSV